MNEMTQPEKRLYQIQNDAHHYWAGRTGTDTQALMGIQMPELVLVEFDQLGEMVGVSSRRVEMRDEHRSNPSIDEDEARNQLHGWQNEIRFAPATIVVRQFFIPDRWIGIRDLPEHYEEVLNRPDLFAPDRLDAIQRDVACWQSEGAFVLYWDEEYYLNREGELESS